MILQGLLLVKLHSSSSFSGFLIDLKLLLHMFSLEQRKTATSPLLKCES